MTGIRPPAVAGYFYPGDAGELHRSIQRYLGAAKLYSGHPKALIVPHAGYVYSGATAAKGFAALEGADVRRVILLGPSHQVGIIEIFGMDALS